MIYHIKHATRFRYSRPVFCEPMTLRLRPREDAAQRLLRYNVWIDPAPAGMCDVVDVDGTAATQIWFNGLTSALSVVVSGTVETLRTNAFDYVLDQQFVRLPFAYPDYVKAALQPYLESSVHPEVAELARATAESCGERTTNFLTSLTRRLQESIERIVRPEGPPLPAEETLRTGQGSCRDIAVLFNDACRAVGLASRFVSGYHECESIDGRRHLHAWSEVYLPGAGWRGFDPAEGLAVADRHVALASGALPLLTSPTYGTFRGTGAESTLEAQIVIRSGRRAERSEPLIPAIAD